MASPTDILLKANGVQIGMLQERDIAEMFAKLPFLHAGFEATRGWAFCHPPKITWPALGKRGSDSVMGPYVRRHIVPVQWELYKRMKMFGITAWGQRAVGDEWVPYFPPIGSGFIWRTWDKDDLCYRYEWYWYNQANALPDKTMRIKVWYEPDLEGNYTSPGVAGLGIWAMDKIVMLSGSRAAFHGSHLPTFLVSTPPPYKAGSEKVQIDFADAEELGMQRDAWSRDLEHQYMDRSAAEAGVNAAYAANRGLQTYDPARNPVLNSESQKEREAREGNGIMDRLVWLDDYRTPVPAAAPVLLCDPLLYQKRMDQICATLVDFPLSMIIEQHAQHAGNFDAQVTFARDRMKAIMVQINADLVDILVDTMRDVLQSEYVALSKKISKNVQRPLTEVEYLAIHRAVHNLVIEQPCTPLVTLDQFIQVWEYGLMDQEDLAEHAAHQLGIPPEEMKVTPLKRARELEMEQAALAKKQATDNTAIEKGKMADHKELETTKMKDHKELETEKLSQAVVLAKSKASEAKKKKK